MIKSKLGIIKKQFSVNPDFKYFTSLDNWKEQTPLFFFADRSEIMLPKVKPLRLKQAYDEILNGTFTFFSQLKFELGKDYDWITNPETGYQYDISQHFSQVQDLSGEAGDIKYVWEKARFSFLYDIIRYDYHFEKDNAEFVFGQIESFIDKNPINQGPNYKCSQEISLRILNWTFALYFYKNSSSLTKQRFEKIMNSIYWQLDHVYKNINFSRIAVRNNHALTETLMLYVSNKLFPFIPETQKWSKEGKKWFEEEISYQIYEDGTYLQYSMNYHRVVVQLLTWGIRLSEIHKDAFNDLVKDKAIKSLHFLDTCLNTENGFLPNYGSNDGALFFKLTEADYRDYRPQLDDLRAVLNNEVAYETESYYWYGINSAENVSLKIKEIESFDTAGYYLINEEKSKTMIRCGAYKDRPAQSDNLHLDIWVKGINYVWDTGTYKYNTTSELTGYFMGVEGHNTISVANKDQMLKGSRFIWHNWINRAKGILKKSSGKFIFKGEITGFKELGKDIRHQRVISKNKDKLEWTINDSINNIDNVSLYQYWHVNPACQDKINIIAKSDGGLVLEPLIEEKWVSHYYGIKEKSIRFTFETKASKINTVIHISE
ncbi:heparinase II/III domain-containing protein [Lutimonas vermicola]|uniref:Heparinase II/III family protein n=1 Tax=Lutimonas vermicola TaxID=414288 RepID=A0ABU9KXU3_9FLAO